MEAMYTFGTEGNFLFSPLTGTNFSKVRRYKRRDFKKAYTEAHRGTHQDILDFWAEFGAVEVDRIATKNRQVNAGLEIITAAMTWSSQSPPISAPALPTKIQLGRGTTAWAQAQSSLVTPITDGFGLDEASATITYVASGTAGASKDIIQAAHTFVTTSGTAYAGANGVNEAAIRTATPTMYCRTVVSPIASLANVNDQLVVTYKSRIVP